MSQYFFLLGPGHLPRQAHEIARQHDAALVNYTEPRGERRHWFAGQNRGAPFDSRMASRVKADLIAAGILPKDTCA